MERDCVLYSSVIYITYMELDRNRKYQVFLSCQKDLKLVCNLHWCRKFPIHMFTVKNKNKNLLYFREEAMLQRLILPTGFYGITKCYGRIFLYYKRRDSMNQCELHHQLQFSISLLAKFFIKVNQRWDIGQQIFDDLVHSQLLNDVSLEAFLRLCSAGIQ